MDRDRLAWSAALLVALVATLGSLSLSGIGPLGWRGLGLFPCELCWYQRILMYPLTAILAVGLWRRWRDLHWIVVPMAVSGALVAGYHLLVQANPSLEPNQCFVGSCTYADRLFNGLVTVPQLSFAAFLLILMAGVVAWPRRAPSGSAS